MSPWLFDAALYSINNMDEQEGQEEPLASTSSAREASDLSSRSRMQEVTSSDNKRARVIPPGPQ